MSFALISVIASLTLILALNWQRLNALGAPTVTRWLAMPSACATQCCTSPGCCVLLWMCHCCCSPGTARAIWPSR